MQTTAGPMIGNLCFVSPVPLGILTVVPFYRKELTLEQNDNVSATGVKNSFFTVFLFCLLPNHQAVPVYFKKLFRNLNLDGNRKVKSTLNEEMAFELLGLH